ARFYRKELPALLREYRLPIGMAVLAALAGLAFGGYIGQNYRVALFDRYLANVGTPPQPGLGLALFIFLNNVRVALLSSLFSLFVFGAFAFLVPAVAFAQIGFVTSTLAQQTAQVDAAGPLMFLLGYVLPHGIVELPTAILGAALGIRIGASLLSPPTGFTVGQNIMWSVAQFLKVWALVLVPLFLVGGLIEGLLTPVIIQALYR
ncbi:MAG TPA: stage II sporulation protein M, partial [Roseiflexaceae bacterium]|nr:stage II sporulation protein M [Roseiflexaceae bacterium]